jgi:hypothetical protein
MLLHQCCDSAHLARFRFKNAHDDSRRVQTMRNPPLSAVVSISQILKAAHTHSRIGSSCRRNRVHSGPSSTFGVVTPSPDGPAPPDITPKTSSTCAECITIVVVPAAVASSAAISFVDIPPVPSDVPRVDVETAREHALWFERADAPCCLTFCMSRTTRTGLASGLLRGLSVYLSISSVDL